MACFTVPLAEALVVTAVKHFTCRKTLKDAAAFKEKVSVLQKMLFGGSFLLAAEHVYHGEVIFYPPFLTAMENSEATAEMLHEMATVGVGMAVLTTAVWALGLGVSALVKRIGLRKQAGAV